MSLNHVNYTITSNTKRPFCSSLVTFSVKPKKMAAFTHLLRTNPHFSVRADLCTRRNHEVQVIVFGGNTKQTETLVDTFLKQHDGLSYLCHRPKSVIVMPGNGVVA